MKNWLFLLLSTVITFLIVIALFIPIYLIDVPPRKDHVYIPEWIIMYVGCLFGLVGYALAEFVHKRIKKWLWMNYHRINLFIKTNDDEIEL